MARNLTFRYAENQDVVVCASDLMAIGAMKALTEMDIFHPVCGFDGITLMGYAGKQMNTVRQNFKRIASEAVIELKRLLDGGEGQQIVLDYELVRIEYTDIIA
jgi:LacI family transcriptional regulator